MNFPRLSNREIEVGLGVLDELSNKEIADRLNISTRTVKYHLSSLFDKTSTEDRHALAKVLSTVLSNIARDQKSVSRATEKLVQLDVWMALEERQRRAGVLAAKGLTNHQVAVRLGVSTTTVKMWVAMCCAVMKIKFSGKNGTVGMLTRVQLAGRLGACGLLEDREEEAEKKMEENVVEMKVATA